MRTVKNLDRLGKVARHAHFQHLRDEHRVRLIAHLEHGVGRQALEAGIGRLHVVQRLEHVGERWGS